MRIEEILRKTIHEFSEAGIESPVLDAEIILSHVLGIERHRLIAGRSDEISDDDAERAWDLFNRRLDGEPVAYITGRKEFYSLEFLVTNDVLIPRPETELLVDLAIFHAVRGGIVLDLGTGSGAIAVSVKHNRSDLKVYASDISEKAIRIARKNSKNILSKDAIKFFHGDLFSPFKDRMFDVIISNPPYISLKSRGSLQREISFEPEMALFAGNDGCSVISKIIEGGKRYLKEDGLILLEISEEVKSQVIDDSYKNGFSVSIMNDFSGFARVAQLKSI